MLVNTSLVDVFLVCKKSMEGKSYINNSFYWYLVLDLCYFILILNNRTKKHFISLLHVKIWHQFLTAIFGSVEYCYWYLSRRTLNGCKIVYFSECGVWDGICLWLSSVAEERDHRRQPHQIPVLHRRLLVPYHPQLHRIRGQSFHIRKTKIEIHFYLQAK